MSELKKYESEVRAEIDGALAKLEKDKRRKLVKFSVYPAEELRQETEAIAAVALGLEAAPEIELVEPPTHIVGKDFALGVFDLAKRTGSNPNEAAAKIAGQINQDEGKFLRSAEALGPFVNIEARREVLYGRILGNILSLGERYGESDINAGKVAVIDYSSPNIAKPIGVGHLRSTIIGEALARIYEATGYSIVRDNHLGDWGTQFGTLIAAYKRWGDEEKIATDPLGELKNLYVRFNSEAEKNQDKKKEMQDEARDYFARLEGGDPELTALWKRFRDLSLKDFARIYDRLGIKFDLHAGESYFVAAADKLVDECLEKGICKIDLETGAVEVRELRGLPEFFLRKQDGSTLYHSRDLAAIDFRVKTFHPDVLIYVVGYEQKLSFEQLFVLAEESGHLPKEVAAKHVDFGLVLTGGKKMSTRGGTLIELDELLKKSVEKSLEILREKNPAASEEELLSTAEMLGIGAIKYNDLRQSRGKNISFDWDRMLDLEGGSAVYLQYTYARIHSIFRKSGVEGGGADLQALPPEEAIFTEKQEFDLTRKLMDFPRVVARAGREDAPHFLATYLEELAHLYNNFYGNVPVLAAENQKLRDSRLMLCRSTAIVIKKGLGILGVGVPEKM